MRFDERRFADSIGWGAIHALDAIPVHEGVLIAVRTDVIKIDEDSIWLETFRQDAAQSIDVLHVAQRGDVDDEIELVFGEIDPVCIGLKIGDETRAYIFLSLAQQVDRIVESGELFADTLVTKLALDPAIATVQDGRVLKWSCAESLIRIGDPPFLHVAGKILAHVLDDTRKVVPVLSGVVDLAVGIDYRFHARIVFALPQILPTYSKTGEGLHRLQTF